jgi:hypothetical protein
LCGLGFGVRFGSPAKTLSCFLFSLEGGVFFLGAGAMLGLSFRQVNSMDIQNLSPEVQQRWDAWLEHRVVNLRDAMGDALGEVAKELRRVYLL